MVLTGVRREPLQFVRLNTISDILCTSLSMFKPYLVKLKLVVSTHNRGTENLFFGFLGTARCMILGNSKMYLEILLVLILVLLKFVWIVYTK